MKKSYLVGALLLLWSVAVWGQTPDEGFASQLKSYVEKRVAGEDAAFTLVQLNDSYKQSDAAAQSHYRELLKREVAAALRSQAYPQALEMIRLHDLLVTRSEDRVPELYLIEGTIYSRQNDSVRLKETIAKLESLERGTHFLPRLNGYLEQMRNYVPADKYLEGYWVPDEQDGVRTSDISRWGGKGYGSAPFYLIKAEQVADTARLTLFRRGYVGLYGEEAEQFKHPQVVIPYAADSLYMLWSTESLRNINPEQVASYRDIVRETSAQASGTFAQRHKYSSSQQLGNQLMTNMVEMGINALISSFSTPKKTIRAFEFRLKRINDRLYRGTRRSYFCTVSADGKKTELDNTYPVNLYRWDKECGIIFGTNQLGKGSFFYGHDKEEEIAAKEDEDGYYMQCYRSCKNYSMVKRRYYEYLDAFNTAQYHQLEIYNQRLLDPSQTPIIEVPEGMQMVGWLGLGGRKATPELVSEHKLTTNVGVVVDSLYAASPALVADLRKGDLVQRVNSKEINSIEALNQEIAAFEPGAEITIEGERAGKPIKRLVRLSYQFIPEN
ncbi:MAG: PDZ domain-containing protein [Alistipes sp.]|nr:PDZ domain-containing protein [Alistipes sp.]